ncbi:MAG: helix-turn-helix domain-containing protein [Treponema sp.]|nr:helix-turn-helix domain-containing protein [Treponema sp.]
MTERELLKVLGENIKLFRGRFNWTQAELAEKVNISINFLSDIETGKKWASPITLVKLSDAFSIEVFELLIPIELLPENINIFMEKYTKDIYTAIKEVHNTYTLKLKKKKINNHQKNE